ncbi:SGNH/GDSL hydrolase family protein [Variovorax sp. GT1P44]|uniref:SGNH/GDSL hydrolase family protein n=1 Tax=Variovorax sp. GT1P44 TaxID=3443742 RepID=UPI003F460677
MVSMKALRLAALSLALLATLGSQAQSVPGNDAAQSRWQGEFNAFASADKAGLPAADGVLFVGSSTIRMWPNIAQDFRQQPVVINRGFGGSTMAECSRFAHDLVVRYKPRLVLVYAGDNDLAEGRTPLQVLESFAQFTNTVRAELPNTRIAYISVKPSPSREKLLPQIHETNNVIAAYLNRLPNSEYIDVFTPMMGADGRPRRELFRGDQLHMNDEGYRLWQSVIAQRLADPATRADASVAQGLR